MCLGTGSAYLLVGVERVKRAPRSTSICNLIFNKIEEKLSTPTVWNVVGAERKSIKHKMSVSVLCSRHCTVGEMTVFAPD
jgi:hypothetical protein